MAKAHPGVGAAVAAPFANPLAGAAALSGGRPRGERTGSDGVRGGGDSGVGSWIGQTGNHSTLVQKDENNTPKLLNAKCIQTTLNKLEKQIVSYYG